MIYFVTGNMELFHSDYYKLITVEESLNLMKDWGVIQYDCETDGIDAHINKLLCVQFGNRKTDIQIVVDCSTINIIEYKKLIESKPLIGQNLKFDIQFLYAYGIIPRRVYDTMIVEQLLYLGYPSGSISYSLKAIAERRLNVDIDKSVRGQIIWRGLDTEVILYAAKDVKYLEDIMDSQMKDCWEKKCVVGTKLECDFVPVIAYLEYCGIRLSEYKWKEKMEHDKENLDNALNALNAYAKNNPKLQKWVKVELQGNLFTGFDDEPKWTVDWQKKEAINVVKALGFNTTAVSKVTKKETDSIMEKVLSSQKGIDDAFLKLYFDYQGYYKVISSFGQGHLNAINPKTGRIHTVYKQLGAASGRMSCGSQQPNESLAELKHIQAKDCTYPNIQQLPHDEITRACFVASDNCKLIDCDWSAAEARLAGDIYNDQAVKDIFLKGIDSHSMYAKIFFKEELKDIDVNDVKKLRPDLRQLAKGPEFALNFGGGISAIMSSIGCSEETANQIIKNYEEGFKGTAEFAKRASKFVRNNGYVLMSNITGHRMNWWDWKEWKEEHDSFTPEFWEDYRLNHKGTNDDIAQMVSRHFKAAAKWDRMGRNAPTQGTCAIMLKHSQIQLFNWVVDNGFFGVIKLCALVHDECLWEVPDNMAEDFAKLIEKEMFDAAAYYCKSLPIPAEASVETHWVH